MKHTLITLALALLTGSSLAQCLGSGKKATLWFPAEYEGMENFVPGDRGEAFTQAGLCSGEGTNTGGFGGQWWITLVGDDEDTPQIDGFADGEEIIIHRIRGQERTRMFVFVGDPCSLIDLLDCELPLFEEDGNLYAGVVWVDAQLALPEPDPYVDLPTRLEVWPTVTDGYVQGFAPAGWLEVYDTLGRWSMRMHVDGPFTLNLSHRARGAYFLAHERGDHKMVFVR